MKDVRILLVGDPQVGKTSLILTLVSEEFPEEVPPRAEEITIPADVTPEKVPTHIVDYSAEEQSDDMLIEEITKANVICVIYDVTNEESLARVTSYWLPFINQAHDEDTSTPVIIIGNKSDLSAVSTMETVLPILNEYPEVETCVECSAKDLKNISEMFYYAQKAVLHPTAPLYSPEDKQLKPMCQKALARIFKISDKDNDGLLNDKELNDFQHLCFNTPLQGQGLQDVKTVVRKNVADGLRDGGLTLKGFQFLHTLFVQRGRHETTWTVLRKFGYADDLQLRRDYTCPQIDVGPDNTTELSDAGYEFLIDLFNRYDKDQDEALSPKELQELFSLCNSGTWGEEVINSVETNSKGWITLQGFLAQWTFLIGNEVLQAELRLSTYLDYTQTLAYLAHFGYTHWENENSLSTALTVCSPLSYLTTSSVSRLVQSARRKIRSSRSCNEGLYPAPAAKMVTRSKALDLQKKQTSRSVFQCYVFGPPGVGKTAFIQGFIGKTLENTDPDRVVSHYTINTVEVHKQEKYLVLREIDWENCGFLLHDRRCDVACFLYDSTDSTSFNQVAQLHEKLPKTVPCLFVATKADGSVVKQDYEVQPAVYCTVNKVPTPRTFSAAGKPDTMRDIYNRLAQMSVYPHLCGPGADSMTSLWLAAGIGAAVVAVLGFVAFRYVRKAGPGT